jgi:peptidoglycan/LPS O-acetylase OafA/YrhL
MNPRLGGLVKRRGQEPTAKNAPGGRLAELDSLRALAALAVVIFHTNASWLPFGWAAVDLFFVLSGFLITSIILRHGDSPLFLRHFYLRRGLRTWPIYYLLVSLVCLASPILARPCVWSSLPFTLTYTQGLSRVWPAAAEAFSRYLAHTWSLAIEEQFYLIWPALVLLVGRWNLVPIALLCACGSCFARSQGIWWDLCSRADGLILGGLLAVFRLDHGSSTFSQSARRSKSMATGLPALAALIYLITLSGRVGIHPDALLPSHPASSVLAFNLLWLGVIDFVLRRSGSGATRLLRLPPLVRLGQVSYGLYLYHFPVLAILLDLARGLGFMGKVYPLKIASIALSIVLAGLSWRFIEQPVLAIKSRFDYQASGRRGSRVAVAAWKRGKATAPRRTWSVE